MKLQEPTGITNRHGVGALFFVLSFVCLLASVLSPSLGYPEHSQVCGIAWMVCVGLAAIITPRIPD